MASRLRRTGRDLSNCSTGSIRRSRVISSYRSDVSASVQATLSGCRKARDVSSSRWLISSKEDQACCNSAANRSRPLATGCGTTAPALAWIFSPSAADGELFAGTVENHPVSIGYRWPRFPGVWALTRLDLHGVPVEQPE